MTTRDLHGILWRADEPLVLDYAGRLLPESEAVLRVHEAGPSGVGKDGLTWNSYREYHLRRV